MFGPRGFAARRAEVTTPSGVEVRDAPTPCRVPTRLLALLQVQAFPRRVREGDLTGAGVACGIGPDLPPLKFHICRGSGHRSVGHTGA